MATPWQPHINTLTSTLNTMHRNTGNTQKPAY